VGSVAGRKFQSKGLRVKRELKLEYGLRDLQKHDRKERYKGIRMEAKSIKRSKSSHFFTLYRDRSKETRWVKVKINSYATFLLDVIVNSYARSYLR